MENTLKVGDRIGVNKVATFFSDIKRGEVVVFKDPANWLGEAQVTKDNSIVGKIKSGLEWAGVLPDPAKQYLIKDRKSTRLNSSHMSESRMPSSA